MAKTASLSRITGHRKEPRRRTLERPCQVSPTLSRWQVCDGCTSHRRPAETRILGPNAASGHASLTFMEETQVRHQDRSRRASLLMCVLQTQYALKLLKPVVDGKISAVEPTASATKAFNDRIQRKLLNSPLSQCRSWYMGGPTNKISAVWPGAMTSFWWQTLKVKWSDYVVV